METSGNSSLFMDSIKVEKFSSSASIFSYQRYKELAKCKHQSYDKLKPHSTNNMLFTQTANLQVKLLYLKGFLMFRL